MYSLKKKKEVLDYIIENDISIYQAEKKFNINRETIRIWMYRYQNSGVKNLKTPKKYNKYTGQFKVNIVINEFKHSYNEIDKENSSLKYQLEQKDEEIDKLKGEILIKF